MFPVVNFSNCDQETSALALQKYTEFIWRLGVLFQTRNGEKLIVCCKIFIFSLLDRLSGGCGLNFWRVGSLENCQIMSKLQHYCSAGHTLDVSAFTHSKEKQSILCKYHLKCKNWKSYNCFTGTVRVVQFIPIALSFKVSDLFHIFF